MPLGRFTAVGLGLAAWVMLTGCLSLGERLERQTRQVVSGNASAAYGAAAKAAESVNADTNFWQAEAGTLALMAGRPAAAITHLDAADNGFNDAARRRYGASAADTAKAVAVNDSLMPYAPEGLDRVFANLYKALACGAEGRPEAMRVELNRARQRQREWFFRCAKPIAEQGEADAAQRQAAMREAARTVGQALPLSAATALAASNGGPLGEAFFGRLRGFGNAYAAHVAGVTRWCAGDASLNDLAMAAALAPENAYARADAASEQKGGRPKGRVWVYVEDGLAPCRKARPVTLPYPSLAGRLNGIGTLSFDVPALETRPAAAGGYSANGVALQPLQDVEALARDQFRRAYPAILARQIARTAVRVAAQEGGHAALRNGGDDPLALLLFDVAMLLFDVSTNAADVRCADLLPKRVWMASLPRPEEGVLRISPDRGQTLSVRLTPRGNALVWVRRPSAGGSAAVMTIDLDRQEGETE